ncbi:MAG: CHRD domain-containing protein [Pseudonocardiaceae bacterium]
MRRLILCTAAASAALLATAVPAWATPKPYVAHLSGAEEVPNPGPAGATGTANVQLDAATGQVCYTLTYSPQIGKLTASHIHRGARGGEGPIVVNLTPVASGGHACVTSTPDQVKQIESDPGGYYVNLHTAASPGGAVRGQLATGA